jgi:N-acyl-D-aspartate/D-glutamate deacylase
MISIKELYQNARNDAKLFSTIDIESILSTVEKHNYLENKTMASIAAQIYQKGNDARIDNLADFCSRLVGYRYVDEIHELHKGKHVRWVRHGTTKITSGGIVVNIKFTNTGTHVLIKNSQNRFIQYNFEEADTFQKMTDEEQLILLAYEQTLQINV